MEIRADDRSVGWLRGACLGLFCHAVYVYSAYDDLMCL